MHRDPILIVGGGIAGLSSAWWLAQQAGERVVLLEAETRHGRHSSGLNAGILRPAIDAPLTRRLALETAAFLRQPPPEFASEALLDARGLLLYEGDEGSPAPRWADALLAADEARELDAGQARERAPHFVPESARAWWLPRCGVIRIEPLMEALAAGIAHAGGELRTGNRVEKLLTSKDEVIGVALEDGSELRASRVVLAAGGWSAKLARTAGVEFPGRPTRRHLFRTHVHSEIHASWPVVWDDVANFYARPTSGGLMVCLCDQEDVDPDACVVDPLITRVLERRLRKSLPGLEGLRAARVWAAMRTLTEDDIPVVGQDPGCAGLFWVAGLGGHGMSICMGLGRVAAQLLLEEEVDADLARALSPDSEARAYTPLRDYD